MPAATATKPAAAPRKHVRTRGGATVTAPARRRSGPAPAKRPVPARGKAKRVARAPFAQALQGRSRGVLDALLRGRAWIALVFVLLAGIVFFNVDLLQMNREIALNAERSTVLKRDNARLKLELARLTSTERIQDAAARHGLALPAPGDVRYVRAGGDDAQKAAKRVTEPSDADTTAVTTAPTTTTAPTAPVAAPAPVAPEPAPVDATPAPTEAAPVEAPATQTPAPVDPTAQAAPVTPTG